MALFNVKSECYCIPKAENRCFVMLSWTMFGQRFRSANADASDMVVDIRLFLWEDGIFAKQTNDVHMKSGYHLFIFHICEMSAGECVCARSYACRFGEPFFIVNWHDTIYLDSYS